MKRDDKIEHDNVNCHIIINTNDQCNDRGAEAIFKILLKM